MNPLPLRELASIVAAEATAADPVVRAVTTDSRHVPADAVFIALAGATHDGHDHISDAAQGGAIAAIVERSRSVHTEIPLVLVPDPGRALLQLASHEREVSSARVVAVTGANGKTTTKDLTAAVLRTQMRTHASPRSFNTEVGVPLAVLDAPPDAEALVLELGARHVGDVRMLSDLVRPDVTVVTNVGVAHLEIFGSWDAIVDASAEPVERLSRDAVAILAADDRTVRGFAARTKARVRTFGLASDADVRAEGVALDHLGRAAFSVRADGERTPVQMSIPGEHMIQNGLAAIAVGLEAGVPLGVAARALTDAPSSAWRMEMFETDAGVVVVNDAYNANPESMAAGLKTARWIARDHRLIAVLGHMAELGPISLEEHERLGDLATRLRVDRLIVVGEQARPIAVAAVREGLEPGDVVRVDGPEEAAEALRSFLRPGDVVFLKGSRVAGLERVADLLREQGVPA